MKAPFELLETGNTMMSVLLSSTAFTEMEVIVSVKLYCSEYVTTSVQVAFVLNFP